MNESQKQYYERLVKIATDKGGRVISDTYQRNNIKMKFQCKEGHMWDARPVALTCYNNWCPTCYKNNHTFTLDELQEHAKSKGGKLLSTAYIHNKDPLEWECSEGHKWITCWYNIRNNKHWCHECGGSKPLTISVPQKHALTKGGKLISTEYVNANTKMEWECDKGHRWMATWGHIGNGKWCPRCAKKASPTMEMIHELARKKNGRLLSTNYVDHKEHLIWQCERSHVFKSSWSSVSSSDTWCPKCARSTRRSKGEEAIENVLKKLGIEYKVEYPHVNLPRVTYDFYFEYKGVKHIIEFDGMQHFKFSKFFHDTDESFKYRQEMDKLKTYVALRTGYKLIRIDYTCLKKIDQYIIDALESPFTFYVTNEKLYSYLSGANIPAELYYEKVIVLEPVTLHTID